MIEYESELQLMALHNSEVRQCVEKLAIGMTRWAPRHGYDELKLERIFQDLKESGADAPKYLKANALVTWSWFFGFRSEGQHYWSSGRKKPNTIQIGHIDRIRTTLIKLGAFVNYPPYGAEASSWIAFLKFALDRVCSDETPDYAAAHKAESLNTSHTGEISKFSSMESTSARNFQSDWRLQRRSSDEHEVIKKLEKNRRVAIHGLPGQGKSVLAAQILENEWVQAQFRQCVIYVDLNQYNRPNDVAALSVNQSYQLITWSNPAAQLARLHESIAMRLAEMVTDRRQACEALAAHFASIEKSERVVRDRDCREWLSKGLQFAQQNQWEPLLGVIRETPFQMDGAVRDALLAVLASAVAHDILFVLDDCWTWDLLCGNLAAFMGSPYVSVLATSVHSPPARADFEQYELPDLTSADRAAWDIIAAYSLPLGEGDQDRPIHVRISEQSEKLRSGAESADVIAFIDGVGGHPLTLALSAYLSAVDKKRVNSPQFWRRQLAKLRDLAADEPIIGMQGKIDRRHQQILACLQEVYGLLDAGAADRYRILYALPAVGFSAKFVALLWDSTETETAVNVGSQLEILVGCALLKDTGVNQDGTPFYCLHPRHRDMIRGMLLNEESGVTTVHKKLLRQAGCLDAHDSFRCPNFTIVPRADGIIAMRHDGRPFLPGDDIVGERRIGEYLRDFLSDHVAQAWPMESIAQDEAVRTLEADPFYLACVGAKNIADHRYEAAYQGLGMAFLYLDGLKLPTEKTLSLYRTHVQKRRLQAYAYATAYGGLETEKLTNDLIQYAKEAGEDEIRISANYGLSFTKAIRGRARAASDIADDLFASVKDHPKPEIQIVGKRFSITASALCGHFQKSLDRYDDMVGDGFDPDLWPRGALSHDLVTDPLLSAGAYRALVLRIMGEKDRAAELRKKVLEDAAAFATRDVYCGHNTHCMVLCFAGAQIAIFDDDYVEAIRCADLALKIANERNLLNWSGQGNMLRHWAETRDPKITDQRKRDLLGELRRQIGSARRRKNWYNHPNYLGFCAELGAEVALETKDFQRALHDICLAKAFMAAGGEKMWAAEIHRIEGVIRQRKGEPRADVARCFSEAISIAEKQGAKYFSDKSKQMKMSGDI